LDHGSVFQFFAQIACRPRPGKHLEARTGIAISPRGSLDSELFYCRDDAVNSDTLLLQAIFDFWTHVLTFPAYCWFLCWNRFVVSTNFPQTEARCPSPSGTREGSPLDCPC